MNWREDWGACSMAAVSDLAPRPAKEGDSAMLESRRCFLSTILGMGLALRSMDLLLASHTMEDLKVLYGWAETREMLGAFPEKRHGISTRKNGSYTVFADVETKTDLLRSNPMAATIWDYCTGENRVDDMVDSITKDFDVERSICLRDVLVTLCDFRRRGLVVL